MRSHICAVPYPPIKDLEQIYPIKVIEYMALGCSIVATKITGVKELINDAGILVEPISPQILNTLNKLLGE